MDEILIEDKKYISSKQAAKVTGYAKDYIGQLCREGRVPARFVGRNWYILESALQDHRFGTKETKLEEKKIEVAVEAQTTWEAPRYEASSEELLPTVQRDTYRDETHASEEAKAASQYLEDSWQAWFSHVASRKEAPPEEMQEAPMMDENAVLEHEEDKREEEAGEVSVPITTVYDLPPKDFLPSSQALKSSYTQEEEETDDNEPERKPAGRKVGRLLLWSVQAIGVLIAFISTSLAVANSGYLDKFIASSSQASIISGITVYNK